MDYLRRITSLSNLTKEKLRGQVATVLILIMVAVLIFIITTLNLGTVSVKTTQLANAADTASMQLASQLASHANYLVQQLGDTEVCVKGGLLSELLSILGSLVAALIPGVGWALIPMIIGGAIGGAIGGGIEQGSLEGAALGALQGAGIGAAMWTGGQIGAEIGLGAQGGAAATLSAEAGLTYGVTGAVIGAAAGATLTAGATIYNASVKDKMNADAVAAIAKQLSGLPQYESMREQTFLTAFQLTVDDPNEEADMYDLDGDNDYGEMVSVFQNWWYTHIKDLKTSLAASSGESRIEDFFEDDLIPFYSYVEESLKDMDREGIECSCIYSGSDAEVNEMARGPIEQLFSSIYDCHYDIFWMPGPAKEELLSWYTQDCGTCTPPAGFDAFDGVRMKYEDFLDYARGLLSPDECGVYHYDAEDLDNDHSTWLGLLYDPNESGDFYDTLQLAAYGSENEKGIQDWIEQIKTVRDQLPGCQLVYPSTGSSITLEDELEQVVDPYCQEYDPEETGSLYPCNWRLNQEELSGIYIPNPVCNLDADAKSALRTEINRVQNFLNNRNQNIINAHFNNGAPCPAGQSLVGPININVTEVCLNGHQMHNKCSSNPLNTNEQVPISYSYSYSYTCSECLPGNCSGTPTPVNGICDCGSACCSSTYDSFNNTCSPCVSNNSCCSTQTHSYTGTEQDRGGSQNIRASDINIPCMSPAAFSGALSALSTALDSPDVPDTFATIDEDWEDEFEPVLDKLEKQFNAITDFLPRVEQFYNDLQSLGQDIRATDGAGVSPPYSWTDSQGTHTITVETGPVTLAYVDEEEDSSFFGLVTKTCLVVENRTDGERCWVKITRQDSGGERNISSSGKVDLGWKWNPFFNNSTITRKSMASYDYNSVGIRKIKW